MESLHIKLNIEEAINSKKALLSTEINLLNLIKKLREFQKIRQAEFKSKNTLRTELRRLIAKIKELQKELPRAKLRKGEKVEIEDVLGTATRGKLERELKEIREKLKNLS